MTIFGSCQEIKSKKSIVKVEVKDEKGNHVSDAVVLGSSEELIKNSPVSQSKYVAISVKTDETGKAVLHHSTYSGLPDGILIQKEGYYNAKKNITWTKDMLEENPPIAELSVTLKKIKNPTPMLYHKQIGIAIRSLNFTYEYDIELGEALPPFGNGKISDIQFQVNEKIDAEKNAKTYVATIKFTNEDSGFFQFESPYRKEEHGAYFMSDYLAPESGYVKEIIRSESELIDESYFNNMHSNENKMYYFRTRVEKNSKGQIIKCHYGKIYGAIRVELPNKYVKIENPPKCYVVMASVYMNPASNDRNIECDTSKNLSPKRDEYNQPIKIPHP